MKMIEALQSRGMIWKSERTKLDDAAAECTAELIRLKGELKSADGFKRSDIASSIRYETKRLDRIVIRYQKQIDKKG
jgi:hypothetical protein